MTTKFGFTKMSMTEFENWLGNLRVARTILRVQQHHTFIPAYAHFSGTNHFERQLAMKEYHVNHNGWGDIGQHFTIFPDGAIVTGRSLEISPACIYGQNSNSICIENLGDFDLGKDVMTNAQRDAIIKVTAGLCSKFNLAVNTNSIIYHHWFDLSTGARNDGTKNNKSCPGTNFFGGNKVKDCTDNFLPLVKAELTGTIINTDTSKVLKYVSVTASQLIIRVKADGRSARAKDREAATLGSVLRVYQEKKGWYKISGSKQHWVSGRYTVDVKRATVKPDALNVRSGPGISFSKIDSFGKDEEVFIVEEINNWCKVSMEEQWVSKDYLTISK